MTDSTGDKIGETVQTTVETGQQPGAEPIRPIGETLANGPGDDGDRDDDGRFLPGTGIGKSTRFTPGNTASLQHGGRSRRVALGAMPEQAEALAALAEQRKEIEDDLGGSATLSRIQRDIVTRYLEASLVANYLGQNLQQLGPLTGKGRTRAAMTAYLQVLDRQMRLGAMLGLERVAKPGQTLEGYLASRSGARA